MDLNKKDIRWLQRFSNFRKAFSQLSKFIERGNLNDLQEQGLIQSFEYTHELAWNTIKDFLESRGNKEIYGSKDTTREAFKLNLIKNGELWMDMIQSRNQSSHTYIEETAKEICESIRSTYYKEFTEFLNSFKKFAAEE